MMQLINEEQFQMARSIAERISHLISLRDELIGKGELQAELVLPSIMWKAITLFSYTLNPTKEIVDTWRLHTYPFTGNYLGYAIDNGHNAPPPKLIRRFRRLVHGLPNDIILRPPRMLGEIGWEVNGGIVNADVVMYQGHIREMYFAGVFEYLRSRDHVNVLEIGAGYGALAHFISRLISSCRFYVVDLPESLVYSAVYLSLASGEDDSACQIYDRSNRRALNSLDRGFVFLPNFLIKDLVGNVKFDLVINTGSFGEMNELQVSEYTNVVYDLLADNGLFYEENQDTFVPVSEIIQRRLKGKVLHGMKRLWAKDAEELAGVEAFLRQRPKAMRDIGRLLMGIVNRLGRLT